MDYRWMIVVLVLLVGCGTAPEPPIGIRCVFYHRIHHDGQTHSDTLEHIFPPDKAADESGVFRQFSQEWHGYEILVSWEPKELMVTLAESWDRREKRSAMAQVFDLTNQDSLLQQKKNFTGVISFNTGDLENSFFSYSCSAFQ